MIISNFYEKQFVLSKREVPRDVRNPKVRKQDKLRRDRSQHQTKSQSGTGPGVRRSKRPLLVCRTSCICSMETLHSDTTLIVQKPLFWPQKTKFSLVFCFINIFITSFANFIRIDAMLAVLPCFIQQYPHQKPVNFRKLRLQENRHFTPCT